MHGLILGAGMYVTGRGLDGPGTLLAALMECSRLFPIATLTVAARSGDSEAAVASSVDRLRGLSGGDLPDVRFRPTGTDDVRAAIDALHAGTPFDFAVVSLPDHLHYDALARLIELGVPTLVVKPLVPSRAGAASLLALQAAHDTYAAVEFHKRWDESNLIARRLLMEGELGRLGFIGVDYWQRIGMPLDAFAAWVDRTDIFQYLGVHYVDLIRFLTGAMPVRLSAYGTRGILRERGVDAYDSIHCTIEWNRDGESAPFASVLNIGWVDPDTSTAMSNQRVYFVGSRGRLDCDQKHRGVEWVAQGRPAQQINPYFSQVLPSIGGPRYRGYALDSVAQFVRDVADLRDGRTTRAALEASDRPTLRSASVSVAVTEAAGESLARRNEWIEIDARIEC